MSTVQLFVALFGLVACVMVFASAAVALVRHLTGKDE